MARPFLVILISLLLAFAPAYVRAAELNPLPELTPAFDLMGYAATTDLVRKEFENIPYGGFEISLPKTWIERTALGPVYGELVRYEGPAFGDVRPYFSFRREVVRRENTARNEMIAYSLKRAYVLRSLNAIDERNIEAMYVTQTPEGDSFVVRSRMRISGSDMFLAEYALPVYAWEKNQDGQTFAIRSLKFLQHNDESIEKRSERSYFHTLKLRYPSSWQFQKETIPADNHVILRLINPGDLNTEMGSITMNVIAPRSLQDDQDKRQFAVNVPSMLRDIVKSYEAKYKIGKTIESRKPDLNLTTSFAAMDVYPMRLIMTQYETDKEASITKELWLAVFKSGDETYIAELVTPSRDQDIYAWSVNVRAFEIILKSIQ